MSNNEQKNVYQIVDEKLITVMEDVTQKVKDTSGEISLATSKYAKFYTVPDYSSQEQFKDTYTYNTLGKQEVMEFTTDFNGYIKQEYKTNANSNTYISLDNSYASVYVNNICILNIQLKKGITTWTFPVKKGDYVQTYVKTGYDGQDGCDFFKAYKIPFSLTIPSIETLPSGSSGSQGATGADGKSAYELAVENGFEGTETEWLASLKGEDGVIGADGKSAYELAVENGYEGTETEWLESLQAKNFVSESIEESMPIGTLIAYSGTTVPTGWLECSGQAVSRVDYAELYAVIGTTYGAGDGSTTFNLPDYRNKFIEGSDTPGTSKDAGLPNITGSLNFSVSGISKNSGSGAIQNRKITPTYRTIETTQNNSAYDSGFSLDASKSNAIYGKSTTVQPASITAKIIIKAKNTNAIITTAELDYSNFLNFKTSEETYWSNAKALNFTSYGWGNGYGFEMVKPCPFSGVMTLRIKSVDASRGIVALRKSAGSEDYDSTAYVIPSSYVSANVSHFATFQVEEGDTVVILVINATGTAKVELNSAFMIPYKTVKVCGAEGKSAYEIAVNNGFNGTETEWLTSLNGATGSSSGDIDWDNPTQIDSISTLTSDTSNSGLTHWYDVVTAPFAGVCVVQISLPSAITSNNINSSHFVSGFVNGNALVYTPIRVGKNLFTIPGVREGDSVAAHVIWSKSASTAKPDIFSFTFYPYIDKNEDIFSTTETKTNKVWIDGKPIYRIVLTGTVTNTSGSVTTIQDITSLNIDTCLSINGTVKAKTTNSVISTVNVASNNYTTFYISRGTDLVYANTNTYLANSPYIVILEYTKTTD